MTILHSSRSSVFCDEDGQPVGFLFGTSQGVGGFATIDPSAVLAADNAELVAETASLYDRAGPEARALFETNPASVAEFTTLPGGVGLGRWANGNLIEVTREGVTALVEGSDSQSIHFIFGPRPEPMTFTGTASTSRSGAIHGAAAFGNPDTDPPASSTVFSGLGQLGVSEDDFDFTSLPSRAGDYDEFAYRDTLVFLNAFGRPLGWLSFG